MQDQYLWATYSVSVLHLIVSRREKSVAIILASAAKKKNEQKGKRRVYFKEKHFPPYEFIK